MTTADEIRDALAATLAHGMAGMTCMDTHDARAFLADRDQWKARAEKAEAEVARLREALAFYARPQSWRSSGVYMSGQSQPSAAELDGGKRARAALEANDAGSAQVQHDAG